ncbi:hypothetical protein BB561_005095, partial [Smittium simulii]
YLNEYNIKLAIAVPHPHTHVERCLKIKSTDELFDFNTMDKLDKRLNLVNKIESYSIKTLPKSLIHKKIVRLPDYAKIKAEITISSKDKSKTVLNNEMHKLKKLNLNIGQDTRASLVTNKTTNKKSFIDVSMFMKSKISSTRAIKYRTGLLGYGTICPVCKNTFRHTHVDRCLKIKNTDELFDFKTMDKLDKRLRQDTRASLVTNKTTNKKSFIDVSMFMKSKISSTRAIKYRTGLLGYGTICPVCKNTFRHTHVERCLKIKNTDELFDFKTMDKLDKRLSNIIDLVVNK